MGRRKEPLHFLQGSNFLTREHFKCLCSYPKQMLTLLWSEKPLFTILVSTEPGQQLFRCLLHECTTVSGWVFCFLILFIYLLAALGLRCCTWAFSSCGKWGLLFVAVCRLPIAVASLVAEHGLQARGLQQLWHAGSVVVVCGLSSCGLRAPERRLRSCGTRAELLRGMWHLPGPGLEPVSPAWAGGFLSTVPPGKSLWLVLYFADSLSFSHSFKQS